MAFKIGGGHHLQAYDPNDGQYVKENFAIWNDKDKGALTMLLYYRLENDSYIIHFPDFNIHDKQYCEMFVEYAKKYIESDDIIIERSKMAYLLTEQVGHDKSRFLARIGYNLQNYETLMDDIKWNTDFKTLKYKIIKVHSLNVMAKTILNGYIVTTAWQLKPDGTLKFITLIPGGDKKWK